VETLRRFLGRHHRDRRRQEAVQPHAKSVERDGRLGHEAGHLPERVDAGVGPRRAHHRHRPAGHLRQRLLEVLLHRRPVVLPLPAAQVGAVVLDDALDRSRHDTGELTAKSAKSAKPRRELFGGSLGIDEAYRSLSPIQSKKTLAVLAALAVQESLDARA
jgi:hypothetical protein